MPTARRPPRGGVRLSAALATAETLTALTVGHTAVGGEPPSVALLAPAAVMVYGAGVLVLRRTAPIAVLAPLLVAGQVLLHAWVTVLGSAAASAGTSHGHAPRAVPGDPGATAVQAADAWCGLTGPMLAAHVVAGLVTALAWALRRRAVEVLLSCPLPRDASAPGSSYLASLRPTAAFRPVALPGVAPNRGPPVRATATA